VAFEDSSQSIVAQHDGHGGTEDKKGDASLSRQLIRHLKKCVTETGTNRADKVAPIMPRPTRSEREVQINSGTL